MDGLGSVPVAVDLAGAVASQVVRLVEGVLGWQVVAVDDPVLPPRCVLVDAEHAADHVGGPVPVVLLVVDGDAPVAVARAARGVHAVLDGVPDAATLTRVVSGATPAVPGVRPPWCTVAASAGGVGATTVATAIAGLRAWEVGPTLAALTGPTHQAAAPLVAASDLAGPAVWTAAAPVVGLGALRVVGVHGEDAPGDAGPVPLVLERSVTQEPADVVVVRPDRAGLVATERATGSVVVVGRGPLDVRALRAVADGRRLVEVDWSARTAAAAAAGRLPTDVPGTWFRPLLALVEALTGRAA